MGIRIPLRKPRLPEGILRVGQRVVGEPFRSADCHSQCAHWLRNDGLFARGTVGQRDTWVPPYTAFFCRGGRPALSARLGAFLVVRRGGALPLPRAPPRVAPTDGHKERGKAGRRGRRPLRGNKKCGMAGGAELRPYAWPLGAGGACSYGVDRVPVGGNDETSAAVMRLGSSI